MGAEKKELLVNIAWKTQLASSILGQTRYQAFARTNEHWRIGYVVSRKGAFRARLLFLHFRGIILKVARHVYWDCATKTFCQINIYCARNRSILAQKVSRATFSATFTANQEMLDRTECRTFGRLIGCSIRAQTRARDSHWRLILALLRQKPLGLFCTTIRHAAVNLPKQ